MSFLEQTLLIVWIARFGRRFGRSKRQDAISRARKVTFEAYVRLPKSHTRYVKSNLITCTSSSRPALHCYYRLDLRYYGSPKSAAIRSHLYPTEVEFKSEKCLTALMPIIIARLLLLVGVDLSDRAGDCKIFYRVVTCDRRWGHALRCNARWWMMHQA